MSYVRGQSVFRNVVCVHETDKAILCEFGPHEEVWIPKSVVHDDSDVYQAGQLGDLVVERWFAQKSIPFDPDEERE